MMALPLEKSYYTYADYLEWDEDVRAEIIDGEVFMLATPDLTHQIISRALFRQIDAFLNGKPCQPFYAPVSVRLHPVEDDSDDTVFEPDIIVVCDPSKLDKRGCNGAPDLVIEILSPSTARHDKVLKFNKYQDAGVREYWIVDPDTQSVQICVLENGRYILSSFDDTGTAPITALPGCTIDLKAVFAGK
ncbi:Uma2 family endonuclease [Treponema primitia]|uniref:Uma2 family endonuclease n=1 Tax=Treponema primitia TaxID=88058 RepID=UPI00397F0264